jgi:hypothetical protein
LESDNRLARAGGHREQHAVLALENRLHGPVNGDLLVIVWNLARCEIERRQHALGGQFVGQLFSGTQT